MQILRIKRIIDLLEKKWEENSKLRLGELLTKIIEDYNYSKKNF